MDTIVKYNNQFNNGVLRDPGHITTVLMPCWIIKSV